MKELRYLGLMNLHNWSRSEPCSLFKCPRCSKYVIRARANGIKHKTCSRLCYMSFSKTPIYLKCKAPAHPRASHGLIYVHVLVAEKKICRYLREGEVVHHIDRDRHNNIPNNIQVMSNEEHVGLHQRGEGNRSAKLTEKDVVEMRLRYENDEAFEDISKDFPVSVSHCYKIVNYCSWKHVLQG